MEMLTQDGLISYLRGIGFKKFVIEEGHLTANVTVFGFGRIWRLRKKELAEIRAAIPVFLSLTLTRKVFGFRLWKITV